MEESAARLEAITKKPATPETSYEYLCADNDFHAVSYHAAGEYLAAEVISTMASHYNRFRLLVDIENIYRERTVSDHRKLIEYVKNRDKDGYREALQKHLCHIITDIDNMSEQYPELFEVD